MFMRATSAERIADSPFDGFEPATYLRGQKTSEMFIVITIMFAGIGLGYLLRRVEALRAIGRPITWTIYLLLFLLGVTVGGNPEIVNNLATLGGEALLLAAAATLGSVLAAAGVYHCFFRERRRS